MNRFVHLHTHSHYSLLDGLGKIDGLISRAKELGMDSLALTDHGNLYGAVEFYKKAKKAGVKPILGVEAYVAPKDHKQKELNSGEEKYYHLILLAKNNTGWKNLIKLVTVSHLEGFYYKPRVDKNLLRQYSEGLIALSACITGEVAKNILNNNLAAAEKSALEYQDIFGKGNFYLEIGHHPGIKLTIKANEGLKALSKKTGIPLVTTQDIHYVKPSDAEYHDILLAVQTGNKLSDANRLTLKEDDFSMRSPDEMANFFSDTPEAIENTVKIAGECNVALELGKTQLPKFDVPENKPANDYLKELVRERTSIRYPELTAEISNRIEFELGVIEKTGFADYFLIVQDFVNWSKDHSIVVGPGRGSAAGSIISYILNITDIDPLKYNLLFERFLNPERIQMPDIDIDIADARRDEVFGYLEEKYGKDRVAHIITFGTMAARAAIRDAGRAMGLSYSFCDQIAKLIPFNPTQGMKEGWLDQCLREVNELGDLYKNNPDAKKLLDAAKNLEGVVRHASVHACGTVIAKEPLTNYMPIQYAPQDENTIITQFEMHSVEDLGLLKMDLLGLKNLTIIENTLRLIEDMHGEKIDISKIPLDDKKTFELLQAADTTGVFQLESSGIRRYLKELKPTELEDIIAMISLYRPGPMELIPQYIKRKFGKERISYLHPLLEPILKNTYGIMIYQEQLMAGARALAGLTLAEADILRKAVGKKDKKLLQEQKEKIINGSIKNGVKKEIAEHFWTLIEPFDRYGFNRCLTGDTEIINAETGEKIKLSALHRNRQLALKTFSINPDFKIKIEKITDIINNGIKPVLAVRTRSGRAIKATGNHPFLTEKGWQKLEELTAGARIAAPRVIPEQIKNLKIEPYKLAMLGYLLAEGNFCHPHGFYFYSKSEEEIKDYLQNLERFKNTVGKIDRSKSAIAVYSKRKNIKEKSAAVEWINYLGLRNKKAVEKFIPEFVFQLNHEQLAILIGKMFQGDGCINIKKKDPQIFYATSSIAIARNLQHLLLRLKILSTIHQKKFKYRGGIKIGYTLTVTRHDNILKFIEVFSDHLIGKKKIILESIKKTHPIINGSVKNWAARGSKDIIPVNLVLPIMRKTVLASGGNFMETARINNFSERLFANYSGKIGYLRETIKVIANGLSNEELKRHAESDILWDEIISIKSAGLETTYDLTIENNHNFIANDIFVHNSHGACYAMIGYQTAYLRAHYPVEFYTSLFNSDAGDVERISILISEAKKAGIAVLPPDVNKSASSFIPDLPAEALAKEGGAGIRFGLLAIKNVGENIVTAIVEERQRGGPFKNLADILQRVGHKDLNKKSLESLLKCGALDSLGIERNAGITNIEEIINFAGNLRRSKQTSQSSLFGQAIISSSALKLKPCPPATQAEKLTWEKELLGLYVSDHPLNRHKEIMSDYGVQEIKSLLLKDNSAASDKKSRIAGIIAKVQKINTKLGQPMIFAKLEDFNNVMEVIVFSDTLAKTSSMWRENNAVMISGKMSWRNGDPKFICDNVREL